MSISKNRTLLILFIAIVIIVAIAIIFFNIKKKKNNSNHQDDNYDENEDKNKKHNNDEKKDKKTNKTDVKQNSQNITNYKKLNNYYNKDIKNKPIFNKDIFKINNHNLLHEEKKNNFNPIKITSINLEDKKLQNNGSHYKVLLQDKKDFIQNLTPSMTPPIRVVMLNINNFLPIIECYESGTRKNKIYFNEYFDNIKKQCEYLQNNPSATEDEKKANCPLIANKDTNFYNEAVFANYYSKWQYDKNSDEAKKIPMLFTTNCDTCYCYFTMKSAEKENNCRLVIDPNSVYFYEDKIIFIGTGMVLDTSRKTALMVNGEIIFKKTNNGYTLHSVELPHDATGTVELRLKNNKNNPINIVGRKIVFNDDKTEMNNGTKIVNNNDIYSLASIASNQALQAIKSMNGS